MVVGRIEWGGEVIEDVYSKSLAKIEVEILLFYSFFFKSVSLDICIR